MKVVGNRKYRYNPTTLMYEVVDQSHSVKVLKRVLSATAFIAMTVFWFWLYFFVLKLDLPKTAILKKHNAGWKSEMEVISRELDVCDQTLSGIEERDDKVYRSIFGLSEVPIDFRSAGFAEGSTNEKYEGADPEMLSTVKRQEAMMKRSYLRSKSFDEVGVLSGKAGDMAACVPSVPPLCPDRQVRLSSPFGGRRDPVRGGYEYHRGQDFATFKGNPVYATGDGVVVMTQTKFNGYGNEIVIDHGFGYTTRYAHLSTIEVRTGMKVSRGERIGSVGSTGKSTGPHLHYEVMYRGDRVNPVTYMDLHMDTEDYRKMVFAQMENNVRGKTSSTSELIRKRGE